MVTVRSVQLSGEMFRSLYVTSSLFILLFCDIGCWKLGGSCSVRHSRAPPRKFVSLSIADTEDAGL